MSPLTTTAIALRALWRNKVRSVLTMLGIVFGIGAVIAMRSSGEGAQQAVREVFQNLGTNVLMITNGSQPSLGAAGGAGSKQSLTWSDLEKGPPPGMPRAGHGDPGARSRPLEEKASNVKDAITRALAILDPDQRELARKILDDRGANDASEQQGPRHDPM